MLYVWTRHAADCKYKEDIYNRRCQCNKWISGVYLGKRYQKTAKTRSWEKAEERRRGLEEKESAIEKGEIPDDTKRITVAHAVAEYMQQSRDVGNTEGTFIRKRFIFERCLLPWAESQALRYLDEITTPVYRKWRSSWQVNSNTRQKRQGTVSEFFAFCVNNEWIQKNPVKAAGKITAEQVPTLPFSKEQFQAIIEATEHFYHPHHGDRSKEHAQKVRILILLMRWSGLAIGDAVLFERSRLHGDNVFLYRAKTGAPVYVPLPPEVAQSLRNIQNAHPAYFFWTGNGKQKTAVKNFRQDLYKVFHIAAERNKELFYDHERGVIRMFPHMLRDTYAVELLLSGVPMEHVSMLLGHRSIKTTERAYAPWNKARQLLLEDSAKKAWVNKTVDNGVAVGA